MKTYKEGEILEHEGKTYRVELRRPQKGELALLVGDSPQYMKDFYSEWAPVVCDHSACLPPRNGNGCAYQATVVEIAPLAQENDRRKSRGGRVNRRSGTPTRRKAGNAQLRKVWETAHTTSAIINSPSAFEWRLAIKKCAVKF